VPDYRDSCPETPEAALGKIDSIGCPTDSDGDGVPDYKDKCPETPEADKGQVDTAGCPLDTDGDGIANYMDNCPTIVGVASNYGCPEIEAAVKQIFEKALTGIQFSLGDESIMPSSYPILDQIAKAMAENPDYILMIDGHTDNTGNPDDNMRLSENRADAVKAYLSGKGVQDDRMIAKGFGDTKPVASNDTEDGQAKNRRVEFIVKFEQ
jgi:outer membrane protein OmpA-like peptidoglycan-associated protein